MKIKIQRFDIVLIFLLVFSFILLSRLFYLQVIKGNYYEKLSKNNYIRIITINPPRGRIFDRNGILLAYDVPYYQLYTLPYLIDKKELPKLKKAFKKYLNIDITSKLEEKIIKGYANKVIIKSKLTDKDIKNFYDHFYEFNGIFIETIPRRNYTEYAKYMPHILGYVGYPSKKELEENPDINADVLIGKSGVEKIYDNYLRGEYGNKAVIVDAKGRIKKILWEKPPKTGKDIYLTIDARLQKLAYESFKESGQKSGSIVLVNPKTYEILTMLNYPIFDIQKFSDGLTKKEWNKLLKNEYKPLFNKTLNGLYPPGSIYKIVVSTAALNEGVVSPTERIFSGGYFKIGKWKYRNWNLAGCGNINITQALEQSCDTYYYQIGLKLGVNKIVEYTYMFGIGKKLNPEIETKVSRVPTPDWKLRKLGESWFLGDTVNLSIGQGFLAITPFDASKILIPVLNNGNVLKPLLLKAYVDKGKIYENEPVVLNKLPIKKDIFSYIKKGLYLVIYGKRGTAKILQDLPVEVAGKTGTAQVYRKPKKNEKIDKWELQNHAWFISFFPYKNPQFSSVVFIEHGEKSSNAVKITKNLIEKMIENGFIK
ncbi:penicillin-binding protein 2 [Hydrogenothermus marinus]|uniref:Penicillin-binding protein 2 n=1 Tax=Hydrogenothermus marinus TaxID=133270 RepID=A0A3M0BIQ6_9AQUI|nr:penicillin-binding protein 2 [Hydrogenothermus marinus]RMA97071.1 penicillin-binding protein 2 [Hydrogenothermus marinus]